MEPSFFVSRRPGPCQAHQTLWIKWFEEPVYGNDARLLANLRRQTRIPISAGQNEGHKWCYRQLLVHEAVDGIEPTLSMSEATLKV